MTKQKNILKLGYLIIVILFTLSFVSAAETDVFKINLKYSNATVNIDSISQVKMNYFAPTSNNGTYKLNIISDSGKELFSEKFDFSLKSFETDETGNFITLTESTKELIIPYFSNAIKLYVYEGEKIILEYDLSGYTGAGENKTSSGLKLLIYLIAGVVLAALIIFLIVYFIIKKKNADVQ